MSGFVSGRREGRLEMPLSLSLHQGSFFNFENLVT